MFGFGLAWLFTGIESVFEVSLFLNYPRLLSTHRCKLLGVTRARSQKSRGTYLYKTHLMP